MATATGNYVSDNSTLANFQAWTTAIFNAFVTTCGWLQTADTGQAANPIASVPSSTYVYWIFKANDAQAATLPIYVKVELGFSSTSPRVRFTVGTGSNGSGTITGAVVSSAPWEITGLETNQGATTFPCFFSGNAGEFRAYMWQSTSVPALAWVFGINRSVDSSGNPTADYFTVNGLNQNINPSAGRGGQQSVLSTSLVGLYCLVWRCCALGSTPGTGAFNGTVTAYPIFPDIGMVGNPMLGFAQTYSGDIADGATVTVASFYGGTHTYIAVANHAASGSTVNNWMGGCTGLSALLMRYE